MPEGPEVRREADRIGAVLVDRPLTRVWFRFPHLAHRGADLVDERVLGVRSWGKAMLIEFEGGRTLYSHNQLYGRWYVVAAGRTPTTGRDLRLALETEAHRALLYSASEIELLEPGAWRAHPFLSKLGPDVFDPRSTPAFIARRCRDARFAGRALGGLLMDQSFLAGLGNYLRSEILFAARLHPATRPRDLDDAALARLSREIRALARRAYRTRGETAPKAWVRARVACGLPRRACRHLVFERAEEPCPACGATIRRLSVASRRLYLCPSCQSEPRR